MISVDSISKKIAKPIQKQVVKMVNERFAQENEPIYDRLDAMEDRLNIIESKLLKHGMDKNNE